MPQPVPSRLVGLPFEQIEYHRRIFYGVVDFARAYRTWGLERIRPSVDGVRELALRGASGLIGMLTNPDVVAATRQARLPAVNISGQNDPEGITSVVSDDDMIGQLAAQYMVTLPLTRYAYVGQDGMLFAERRGRGFFRGLTELGVSACIVEYPDAVRMNTNMLYSREHPFSQWLLELPKPVGIFCSSDLIAFCVHQAARYMGLDLHRELVLMGVDNQQDYCEAVNPPFSSVEQGMIGFRAAETLERLMNGQRVPRTILVAPRGVIARGGDAAGHGLPSEVQEVMQLIASRLGEPLQIDDLLQNVPLSRRYIEKRFKQATGRSIYQEVQRQRIERACMLLRSTRWPVERVGTAAGFADPRQFSRAFRQHTQTTPMSYRKQHPVHPSQAQVPLQDDAG